MAKAESAAEDKRAPAKRADEPWLEALRDRTLTPPVEPHPWPEYYPPIDGIKENLLWRLRERTRCSEDPARAQRVRELCRRDMLYWWAGWCWIFEVRPTGEMGAVLPFVPFHYQLRVGLRMASSIVKPRDMAFPKTRDMGVTWLALLTVSHGWLFRDGFAALLTSEKETLVDRLGDWNTLFEKVRFNLQRQPPWMMPDGFDWSKHDKYLFLQNPKTGAGIRGEATTKNAGRSGRYNIIMMDEHAELHQSIQLEMEAATADAAASRWYVSTPKGDLNTFFKKCHSEVVERVDVHFVEHPVKGWGARQLIEFKKGKVVRGDIVSPWFDAEVERRDQPEWMIRQELQISFEGSLGGVVDGSVLSLWRQAAAPPVETRYLKHRFDGNPALMVFERPVDGVRYIIGADPSGGSLPGSFSAVQVFRLPELRQVAEYQGRIGVDLFPSLLHALGKEYNWAYICVESNMGASTLSDLLEGHIDKGGLLGPRGNRVRPYPTKRIARRTKVDGTVDPNPKKLGIHTGGESKRFMVYSLLEPYVRNQEMAVSGRRTLSELAGFRDEGTKIRNQDGDDLVMALCVMLYGLRFMSVGRRGAPAPMRAR